MRVFVGHLGLPEKQLGDDKLQHVMTQNLFPLIASMEQQQSKKEHFKFCERKSRGWQKKRTKCHQKLLLLHKSAAKGCTQKQVQLSMAFNCQVIV